MIKPRSLLFASVTGLADLSNQLGNIAKAAHVAAAAKSADIAAEMVDGMKARVEVDTGGVRDSIRAEPNEDGTVTVKAGGTPETARPTKSGETYDAAVILEHGTIHQPGEPFFWPEVDATRERHGQEVFQAVKDATGAR